MSNVKNCLIAGRANVGKTLLLLNFAEYCGVKEIELRVQFPQNAAEQILRFPLPVARARLVGMDSHLTRCLQSMELSLPKGKGRRNFRLVDSTGLTDSVHTDSEVRLGMAQTLRMLRQADIIIHVLDAAAVGETDVTNPLSDIDLQICRYAPLRCPYLVVANKIDLPWAAAGLATIQRFLPHHKVVPVSAMDRTGFREVKAFVWDHL